MSITPSSSAPAVPSSGVEGLEDVTASDLVMPTLRIDHQNGKFINQLSNEEYENMDVIILGLVKQRVLWPAEILPAGSKERPLCRSYNFMEGHPNEEKFPWEASGFTETKDTKLPCASCKLKEWDTHPTRSAPWCSEQHTFAMLMTQDNGEFSPILISFQRSGLKESRAYISAFQNARTPLFTVHTQMSLEARKRGSNPYCVPKFVRGGLTQEGDYVTFSTMYRQIREFLQTPWSGTDDEEEKAVVTSDTTDAPDAPLATTIGSPLGGATAPASAPEEEEDELPF